MKVIDAIERRRAALPPMSLIDIEGGRQLRVSIPNLYSAEREPFDQGLPLTPPRRAAFEALAAAPADLDLLLRVARAAIAYRAAVKAQGRNLPNARAELDAALAPLKEEVVYG